MCYVCEAKRKGRGVIDVNERNQIVWSTANEYIYGNGLIMNERTTRMSVRKSSGLL